MSSSKDAVACRVYRRLFRVWMPATFRRELERPALDAFEDLYREARASKRPLAVARLFLRETASLLRVGWHERRRGAGHRREGFLMDATSDVKIGLRHLRRSPGFTAVALAALALGIGMNTAILSLAHAVLVAPLPYPDSERLCIVSTELVQGGSGFSASYPDLRDLSERNRSFSDVAFFLDWQSVNLSGGDRPERAPVNFVTPRYLSLLGFRADLGRLFVEADDGAGPGAPVVILSHALWEKNFGGRPDVIGHRVVLNDVPFEVVGVLSKDATDLAERFGESANLFVPLGWVERLVQLDVWERRSARYLYGLARLRPGVSHDDAVQDVHLISALLARDHPDTNEGWRFVLEPVAQVLLGDARESTWVLLGGAGLVLLLVCANLAGLLLVQGVHRSRELAMRHALGAGSGRVVRQLVAESLLVSVLGGSLGTLLALGGTSVLSRIDALGLPSFVTLSLDARALVVSLLLAAVTGLAAGLVPARRAGAIDALAALRGGRSTDGRSLARSTFLVSEIALAIVLLAGAVLTFESFRLLHETELGFDTEGLASAQLDLRGERYDSLDARRAIAQALVERAESLPGVDDAFLWSPSRIGGGNWVRFVTREHRFSEVEERIEASRHHVMPGAIRKLGIGVVAGRDFEAADGPGARPVAIVSESLAAKLWPGDDPLGKRFDASLGRNVAAYEVIGVSADVRHRPRVDAFLTENYDVYFSYSQEPERNIGILVRMAEPDSAASVVTALRRAVAEEDETLPIYDVSTMAERLWQEEARSRVSAIVVGAYALLALALAAIGIYGALALAVRQRVREFGVRIALGAGMGDIVREVLGYGARVFFVGSAIGLSGAFAASRLLSSVLFGSTTLDAARLSTVVVGLGIIASLGCYLPARQASRVDPTTALREETP